MTDFGSSRTRRRGMMIDTRHHSSVQDQTDGKTILVVEDNEDVGTFLVLMLLTESPYQALLVTDGFQALKMVHELKPSLFLVDYQLPGMDGIALYDHLHAITDLADIPAIIISANLPTRSLQERHLTGIAKPFRSRPTAPHDCTTPRVDQHGGHVPKADEQLHHALKPKRGGKYIVAAEIRKLSRNWLEPRHQRL